MSTPNLYRVILPVTNIETAAAFYAAVLEMPGQRVSPGRHYFTCGGTILACFEPVADGNGLMGGWKLHPLQYVYFAVADLAAALARFKKAGGTVEQEIRKMPWGETMFYGKDPFGGLLSFVDEKTVFRG